MEVPLTTMRLADKCWDPMEEMAMFYNSYQSAAAALEKISGVLEEEPSVPDPVKPTDLWTAEGHVRFDDVTFAYKRDRVILSIREEFRENASESDATKVGKMIEDARAGLDALRQQCGMNTGEGDINYQYDAVLQKR